MARLNPYIAFQTEAREAMEFYRSVLGGELEITPFGDDDAGAGALVMHAQLETPDGLTLMASDTPGIVPAPKPAGFWISIDGDDEAKLEGWWNALSDGGTIEQPLETPPWGGRFGMLTDRFGIRWMVSIDTGQ